MGLGLAARSDRPDVQSEWPGSHRRPSAPKADAHHCLSYTPEPPGSNGPDEIRTRVGRL